ncbi:hypothetical protein Tco_0911043 [Tanacetum coccineum]|uniref:Uncharacterized protein n=1 Tax=Tanacetum coccineum TaxID=301880 RepID=A0ABQ5CWU2_9ASTR
MMEIKVQHENLSTQTSPLLTVPVLVILESSTAPAITIPPPIPPFIPFPQQSTPILAPTTTEATISITSVPDSTTRTAIYQRVFDLEKEVKILKDINHDLAILVAIKSEVPSVVKECLRTNLDDTIEKSIIEDKDAMDKGVADRLKKRKPNDANKDEGPPGGPNQWLKRRKTSKETEPSKKAKSTGTSKGTTKSQPKSTGKSSQAEETMFETANTQVPQNPEEDKVDDGPTQKWLSDLAKPEKPSKMFNELMSTLIDFTAFAMNRLQISDLTKADLAAKYDLQGIEDMVPTLWSPIKVAYNKHAALVTKVKVNKWYGYGHLKEIEARRSDQQLYTFMEGDFPRLHLNDIEDMLLLVVQKRLFNLKGEDIVIPMVAAAGPRQIRFIATCSYSTGICKDIMKAQVHVSKASATLIPNVLLEATKY